MTGMKSGRGKLDANNKKSNSVSYHKPLGSYTHVRRAKPGIMLFVSGQVSVDSNGSVIGKNNAKVQVRQAIENLRRVLHSEGASLQNVMKTTWYLTDIRVRKEVNSVYSKYFKTPYPASTLVVVKELAVRDLVVEVDAIAVV